MGGRREGAWGERRGGKPGPGFEQPSMTRRIWAVAQTRARASSLSEAPVRATCCVGSDTFSDFSAPRFSRPWRGRRAAPAAEACRGPVGTRRRESGRRGRLAWGRFGFRERARGPAQEGSSAGLRERRGHPPPDRCNGKRRVSSSQRRSGEGRCVRGPPRPPGLPRPASPHRWDSDHGTGGAPRS